MVKHKIKDVHVIRPGSAPDIDVDFHTVGRERVAKYAADKYGHENVSNIVTYGGFKAKNSLKSIFTIYNLPFTKANAITKLMPGPADGKEMTIDDMFDETNPRYDEAADFRNAINEDPEIKKMVEWAKPFEGRIRGTGVHACFVARTNVLTDKGYKHIEDIKVGDKVFTHKRRFKEVVDTIITENQKVYEVKINKTRKLIVTGNHPIYSFNKKTAKLSWKPVEELDVNNDLVAKIDNNNKLFWDTIIYIKDTEKTVATTFNLSVIDDNSYVANGVVVHNCGIIMSNKPLNQTIPTQVRQTDNLLVTQWTYPKCESLGLIKMDFLGLDTLDVMENTLNNIKIMGKEVPNMREIVNGPMDDEETYKMLQRGDTVGIFQLGGQGVQELLQRMKPTEFMDIAATTALYRPGPMKMNSHIEYADRKNGRSDIVYIAPSFKGTAVERILKSTYGLCIPKGTMIFDTTKDKFVPIEELKAGTSITPSYSLNSNKLENKLVSNVVNTGKKDILRLHYGTEYIDVSTTHPILTERGYVEAKDLNVGDNIAKNNNSYLRENTTNNLTPDQAWLLGVMLGDGTFKTSTITTVDTEIIDKVKSVISSEFKDTSVTVRKRDNGVYNLFIVKSDRNDNYQSPSQFKKWTKSLGFLNEHKLDKKQIPKVILQENNENLLYLLAGLFDTDGHVENEQISWTGTSSYLYEEIKMILNILGINYSTSETPYINNKRKNKTAYKIYPNRNDFHDKIQPYMVLSRKKEIDTTYDDKPHYPLFVNNIVDYFNNMELNVNDLQYFNLRSRNKKNKGEKLGLKAWATFIENKYNKDIHYNKTIFVKTCLEENILPQDLINIINRKYSRITSIEYIGQQDCYDIEVDDNHNFLVNNIIVHNCIYQEQIMQIATDFAGMSSYEADQLRKAMGKKKLKLMESLKPKFVNGCIEVGKATPEDTELLWDTIAEFAKYGFNKSHSISYAINAYQTCYLKAHYPAEFMAALLQQNARVADKLPLYLQEAKHIGLRIGSVDINDSYSFIAPSKNHDKYDIIYGFAGIKQVSDEIAEAIVAERDEHGPYTSVANFVERIQKKTKFSSQSLKYLSEAGAFDSLGVSRKAISEKAAQLLKTAKQTAKSPSISLFDLAPADEGNNSLLDSIDLSGAEYPYNELLKNEADSIGFFVSGHPVDHAGICARQFSPVSLHDVKNKDLGGGYGATFNVLGTFTIVQVKTRKNGSKSIAVRFDDGQETLDTYLPPKVIARIEKGIEIERVKKLQEKGEDVQIGSASGARADEILANYYNDDVKAIAPLEKNDFYRVSFTQFTRGDEVRTQVVDIEKIETAPNGSIPYQVQVPPNCPWKEIKNLLKNNPGDTFVSFVYDEHTAKMTAKGINLTRDFIIQLEKLVGANHILTQNI